MGYVEAALAVITAIAGLVLYFLKQSSAKDIANKNQATADEAEIRDAIQKLVSHEQDVNTSIDLQKKASQDWGKDL